METRGPHARNVGPRVTNLPSLLRTISDGSRIRGERNAALKLRLAAVALISMALAGAVFAATSTRTNAQADLPQFRVITYVGVVTVGGQPAQDGLLITARVGGYESEPVKVGGEPGQGISSGSYTLNVGPAPDYEGMEIEFWIEGQVKADQTGELFGPLEPGKDTVCLGCAWSLPILRRLDLTFPSGPVPTPTQTFTPTATRRDTGTGIPVGHRLLRLVNSPGRDADLRQDRRLPVRGRADTKRPVHTRAEPGGRRLWRQVHQLLPEFPPISAAVQIHAGREPHRPDHPVPTAPDANADVDPNDDADPHAHHYAHTHGNADGGTDQNANTDTDTDADGNTDTDAYPGPRRRGHGLRRAHDDTVANGNADANADAYPHVNTDSDTRAYANPTADADADARANRNPGAREQGILQLDRRRSG